MPDSRLSILTRLAKDLQSHIGHTVKYVAEGRMDNSGKLIKVQLETNLVCYIEHAPIPIRIYFETIHTCSCKKI